jgi:LacI family transcriptional regulator
MHDVAARAGVSIFTVSRVVNQSGFVRESTRQRVEEAIAELNYVPSAAGRRLRSGKSHAVGLLMSDVANPFWNEIIVSIQAYLSDRGYGVILGNARSDLQEERRQLEIALRQGVDGFIAVPLRDESQVVPEILHRNISCVVLDRRGDFGTDVVRRDLYRATTELVELLLELHHQRIALVNGPRNHSGAVERFEGYGETLRQAGISVDEALVTWGPFTQSYAARATEALLKLPDPPTAVIAVGNMHAVGVLETLGAAEMVVPDDISVVGFDATPALFSFLTVAASNKSEIGETAAEMLYQRLQGYDGPPREQVFGTELHLRLSAGLCAGKEPSRPGAQSGLAGGRPEHREQTTTDSVTHNNSKEV